MPHPHQTHQLSPTHLTKVVVLFIIVQRSDVAWLANEQEVGGECAPAIPLLVGVEPLPVEVNKVVFRV